MMEGNSRPKRDTKAPNKFTPWEEGEAAMGNERKRKSRERESFREKMRKYRGAEEGVHVWLQEGQNEKKDDDDGKSEKNVEMEEKEEKEEKEDNRKKKKNVAAHLSEQKQKKE